MIFRPCFDFDHGCAAYVFGCGGRGLGAVVDPSEEDVDQHVAFAHARGLRITHVVDTHVHADHRSGGPALAEMTGARCCLHRSADVRVPFHAVDVGDLIDLGNTEMRVLHTRGHPPESIALVVTDLRRGPEPWFVLSGDTLFSGAVGRPDLPGDAAANARRLLRSVHDELRTLRDDVEVYPAHFGGPACGAGLSGRPSSTIGFERRFNEALLLDEEGFVEKVGAVPPKPEGAMAILGCNRRLDAA